MSVRPTRRAVLAGLAAALAGRAPAKAGPAPRIVSLDYALAEMLVGIGIPPVGVAGAEDWDVWVVEPPLPPGVVDVGAGLEPNLELLAALKPDMILTTPYVAAVGPLASRIAPVREFALYAGGDPLARARAAALELGHMVGRPDAAGAYLAAADRAFDALAGRVARLRPPPIAVVAFQDARHARIFGRPGLYQSVMDRIGLSNAWTGEANDWGFGVMAVEDLASLTPDLHLMSLEPVPPDAAPTLARSPLWTALPFVAARRVSVLPASLMFGGVSSALRFARLAVEDLEARA
ncbi:ABC transporter substrate-binding protein [Chthonobacter rhizosphaerae]|uniref:ABC transporter substrate-binding protein n=1 Tax=Chthonobacter rhizosphaerae TaxID=2735553 RepID=UPI0015EF67C3|nr:ABC transporter substrate-binding protein [Chthonobacter rhizosphaerae]